MLLKSISFENYKSFPNNESIEIKPLTILVGRNNSGKSVIARLPLLIANSFRGKVEIPLGLKFEDMSLGASFLDLIHNRVPHGSIGIGAEFTLNGDDYGFWSKVQHFDEYRLQIVTDFEFKLKKEIVLSLTWIGNDPLKEMNLYKVNETGQKCSATFSGLIPVDITCTEAPRKGKTENVFISLFDEGKTRDEFGNAINRITYLGPFRKEPKRFYGFPEGIPTDVGFSGKKVADILGDDFLRRRTNVISAVGKWFSENLGGWTIDLIQHGDAFSVVLRNPRNESVEVNLADVGTGISQVLPIVVQRQFEASLGQNSILEIVEQPEIHLHPSAHGDLADLYIKALRPEGTRFIIETHSENFLLRIRRRVADGSLDHKDIIIYWVKDDPSPDQFIQPISIDEKGEVDDWPTGVFSEDFDEVRAIREAQKNNKL